MGFPRLQIYHFSAFPPTFFRLFFTFFYNKEAPAAGRLLQICAVRRARFLQICAFGNRKICKFARLGVIKICKFAHFTKLFPIFAAKIRQQ